MPKVFEKDSKINLVEYGDHCFQPVTIKGLWKAILSLFSNDNNSVDKTA